MTVLFYFIRRKNITLTGWTAWKSSETTKKVHLEKQLNNPNLQKDAHSGLKSGQKENGIIRFIYLES
jgi:hypothetical protein